MRISRRHALLALPGFFPFVAGVARADDFAADRSARWLAGMVGADGAAGASPSPEWKAYAKVEEERWLAAEPRLRAIQDWAARELAPLLARDQALFYPFAGPDALHALALFGTARRMLLVGLEPVGVLPDPQPGAAAGFFPRLGNGLADLHRLTFFRTREMSSDFHQDGVLPVLVATVARMGGRVVSVTTTAAAPSALARARIDWTSPSGQPRRLDYLQADLSNAGLNAHVELAREVQALGPCVTFVKAAMYLLAEARFSQLRQMILDDSALLLQDDTGIPIRHLGDRWALRLFGRYETPVTPFEDRVQRDLQAEFERRPPSVLPFGIGYHVDPRRSNLVLASKGR